MQPTVSTLPTLPGLPALLLPFLAVITVLTITPGPDMALVLRNAARGGARSAWYTGLGCCAGIAIHACASVLGLGALLAASAAAFTVVKLAGAGYLIWLGLSALWHSRHRTEATEDPVRSAGEPADPPGRTLRQCFRQGLVSDLLNPKIALLFLTLLPQFVADGEPRTTTTAVLALIFLVGAVLWWRVFSLTINVIGTLLERPVVRRWLQRCTGAVLVGVGIRVALDRT